MSNKDGFLNDLKHMVFEDDPEAPKAPVPAPHAAPVQMPTMSTPAAAPYATPSTFAASSVSVSDNDEIYRVILAKTNFDGTEVGNAIHKFLAPLANLPMDDSLKFKTAVAQAKAQLGLTDNAIVSAFDALKAALQQEQDSFAAREQQFTKKEIAARQDRINQITTQMAQLQQELSEVSSGLIEAQNKATNAHTQFVAAMQRRANEIDQQKAQYTAMLK